MKPTKFYSFLLHLWLVVSLAFQPLLVPSIVWAEDPVPSETPAGDPAPPANQAPVAQANGPYRGNPGAPIAFSSLGSADIDPDGTIASYEWDYSYDGVTFNIEGTVANPSYAYATSGSYTAGLRVTDNLGLTSAISTAAVTINVAPVAKANGPYKGKPGVPLALSSLGSADPDGTIASYAWDYSYDGATFNTEGTSANPSYTYAKSGSYTAALRVKDNEALASAISSASVVINAAPIVSSIEMEPIPAYWKDELDGKVRSYDPEGNAITLKRQWKKNGVAIAGQTSRHIELDGLTGIRPGDALTVTVEACDAYWCSTPFTSDPIIIANNLPTAVANGPYKGIVGQPLTFSGKGSSDVETGIASYEWDSDYDGKTFTVDAKSSSEGTSFTYTQGGLFKVALRVIDETKGVSDIVTTSAQVNGPPVLQSVLFDPAVALRGATFGANPLIVDAEGDPVVATYQWQKNGTLLADATEPSLDLSNPANAERGDTLQLHVTACDPYNCAPEWVSEIFTVQNAPPVPDTGGPYVGWPGKIPSLSGMLSHDQDGSIVKYEWDLNYDGNTFDVDATTKDVTPPFSQPGIYQVALRVTDNDGEISPIRSTTCTICEQTDCKNSILLSNNNNANVSNSVSGGSNTGGNVANGGQAGSSADDGNGGNGGAAAIKTGNAKGSAFLENILNTNIVGSNWKEILVDVHDKLSGDINLYQELGNILDGSGNAGKTLLSITNENVATVANFLSVLVSSGNNSATGGAGGTSGDDGAAGTGGSASIITGNAMAVANLLNVINSNIVGANFLLSIMNIFGLWVGDLILPGDGVYDSGASAGDFIEVANDNTADINNSILANADTGGNVANGGNGTAGGAGGNSSVTTGSAQSISKILNLVNANITGGNYLALLPNILGNWEGTVIDGEGDFWINLIPGSGHGFRVVVSNKNTATITNVITLDASTGGNSAQGGGNASISTGNAMTIANILNLVNANITGGNFIFAVVNLFGTWRGNIVYAYPDLAVAVEGDKEVISEGDTLNYTVACANGGRARAKDAKVTQILPDGVTYQSDTSGITPSISGQTLTWAFPAMQPGDLKAFEVVTKASQTFPVGDTDLDTAVSAETSTPEKHFGNNVAGDHTLMQVHAAASNTDTSSTSSAGNIDSSSLIVSKSNDAKGTVGPGSVVHFAVQVLNKGIGTIENLKVEDVFRDPKGNVIARNHWDVGAIAPSEQFEITYSTKVPEGASAGTYTNVASAQGKNAQSKVVVASKEATSPVSVDPLSPVQGKEEGGADQHASLVVEKTNNLNGPVPPGTKVGYTVTIKNNGSESVSDVVVHDKLVNGFSHIVEQTALNDDQAKVTTWKLGTLKPGTGMKITYELRISQAAPPGMYTNITWADGKDPQSAMVRSNTASSTIEIISDGSFGGSVLGVGVADAAVNPFLSSLGDDPSFAERVLGINAPCQGWPIAVWIALLFAYIMLLVWFFFFDGDRFRVLFPTALTVVTLGLYLLYACPGSILWWPVAVLASGIVLSILAVRFPHHKNPSSSIPPNAVA